MVIKTSDINVEPSKIADFEHITSGMQMAMLGSRLLMESTINDSVAHGGPSSTNEALINLMQYCGISTRTMAQRINISRTKLKDMLDGKRDIPPIVLEKMDDIFKSIKPDLYK